MTAQIVTLKDFKRISCENKDFCQKQFENLLYLLEEDRLK